MQATATTTATAATTTAANVDDQPDKYTKFDTCMKCSNLLN